MYVRWTLYVSSATVPILLLPGALLVAMSMPDGNPAAVAALVLVALAQFVACLALLRAGLSTLLGGPPPDRRLVAAAVVLTATAVPIATWTIPIPPTVSGISFLVLIAGGNLTTALTPVLSRRGVYAGIGLGAVATIAWCAIIVGDDWPSLLTQGVLYTLLVGLAVVFYRVSEWMLVLVWELDAARTVQAKLAVAEERLRFARDFHDVLGRNLTLIAVTSDLAAGLARRGDPDAVDKMLQVRSLAHESAREVREVVTGYRAADLDTELAGARSVLRAAGITTRVIGDNTCVPGDAGAVSDDPGGDPGRAEHRSGAGEFGVQVRGPVPGDDFPYFAGGFVGDAADLQHLVDGFGVAAAGEPRGEVAGDRDQGEVPAEDVVEVPGEPQPLLRDRQSGLHRPGCVDLPDQHQHPFRDPISSDDKPDHDRVVQAQPHWPRPVVVAGEGVPASGDRSADPYAGVERLPVQHRRQRRGQGSTEQQDNDEHDEWQLVRGGFRERPPPRQHPGDGQPGCSDDQRSARRRAAEQGAESGV